jgi:hypothetical protein
MQCSPAAFRLRGGQKPLPRPRPRGRDRSHWQAQGCVPHCVARCSQLPCSARPPLCWEHARRRRVRGQPSLKCWIGYGARRIADENRAATGAAVAWTESADQRPGSEVLLCRRHLLVLRCSAPQPRMVRGGCRVAQAASGGQRHAVAGCASHWCTPARQSVLLWCCSAFVAPDEYAAKQSATVINTHKPPATGTRSVLELACWREGAAAVHKHY